MSEHRITFITAPTEVAEQIATTLVEEDLAACVNLVDRIKSIYKWEGQVEHSSETLLIAKAMMEKTEALIDRVLELHPFEVPEIVSFDITAGSKDYLDWLSGKEIVIEDDVFEDEDLDMDEEGEGEEEEEEEETESEPEK